MILEKISWDSDFFKRKVGKILYSHQYKNKFIKLINDAKSQDFDLIYVFADKDTYLDQDILTKYNGKLVDRKVLYRRELTGMTPESLDNEPNVLEYVSKELDADLENLTYLSGTYSRFKIDEGFFDDDYYRLYKTWILKSLSKELADKVFVYKEGGRILGMVTLKYKENIGDIGLIAVDDTTQGKGIGKKLINVCIKDLLINEIREIEVATQEVNDVACLFYEKRGFSVKNITNIYHFWL